jgi:hypothetical protein
MENSSVVTFSIFVWKKDKILGRESDCPGIISSGPYCYRQT